MSIAALTPEERSVLERRTSPDLTPRESLQSIELQTRLLVQRKAESPARTKAMAECAALAAEINALDFNADGMGKINGVGQRAMDLHRRITELP